MKVTLSPDIIFCGWLGLKHKLTRFVRGVLLWSRAVLLCCYRSVLLYVTEAWLNFCCREKLCRKEVLCCLFQRNGWTCVLKQSCVVKKCFVVKVSALLHVSERRRHTQKPADEGHGSAKTAGRVSTPAAVKQGMGMGVDGWRFNRQTQGCDWIFQIDDICLWLEY